jgi:hypothetical protein
VITAAAFFGLGALLTFTGACVHHNLSHRIQICEDRLARLEGPRKVTPIRREK